MTQLKTIHLSADYLRQQLQGRCPEVGIVLGSGLGRLTDHIQDAKVFPSAYIGGPYRPFRKTQLSFGRPVSFEGLDRRVDSGTLKAATERIEDAVWGLKQP